MKFSVILPIYNVQDYLQDAIESVLDQDYKDIEIILVDDGSTDNCPIIADNYAAKYSFIHVIHQKNAGLSAARNSGLKKANGEYVFFLDSDDKMVSGILNKLNLILLKAKCPDFMIGNIYYLINNDLQIKHKYDVNKVKGASLQETIENFVKYYQWIPWAAYQSVYKRKFLIENELYFNENNIGAEDCDFFLRISLKASTYDIIDDKFVYYRVGRVGSIITNPKKKAVEGQLESFRKGFYMYKNLDMNIVSNFFANRFVNIVFLIGYLSENDVINAVNIIEDNKQIFKYTDNNLKYIIAKIFWKIFGYYKGSKILLTLKGGSLKK